MFEAVLDSFLHLINGAASGIYAGSFLTAKRMGKDRFLNGRVQAAALWLSLYFPVQCLSGKIFRVCDVGKTAAETVFLLALGMLLYKRDLPKQFFVTVSFLSGKEIIRYILLVLFQFLYGAWMKILLFFVKHGQMISLEEWDFPVYFSVFTILFFCIFVYARSNDAMCFHHSEKDDFIHGKEQYGIVV